jgi:hypothetical protein
MLQSFRNAALLATVGVVLMALFPTGTGSFTATHGPVTAVRAVVDHVLDFPPISLQPITQIADRELHAGTRIAIVVRTTCDRGPILALRC